QHLSTGLHCTRSSIETHGPGLQSSKPFPGITTEDRECVMRLILLLSFLLKKAARSTRERAAP
ncbi:MAG TPA: hypothetical protein VFI36_08595, partial [Arthrobacter sp.]|nr:hypothetical protein [Arthrobacter sp.]